MNTSKIQCHFFKKLESKIPKGQKLAEIVAITLDLDLGSCYKRLRGDTALKLEEFVTLAQKFDISIDNLLNPKDEKRFRISDHTFIKDFDQAESRLDRLIQDLDYIKDYPHKFYFAARDIPPALSLRTEELCRFKLFVWITSSNIKALKEFSPDRIPSSLIEKMLLLGNKYYNLNQNEIWTNDTFNPELIQITEGVKFGHITSEQAIILLRQYKTIISEQYELLENGDDKLNIYHVDYLPSSNQALLSSEILDKAYLHLTSINYLQAKQAELCAELKRWFTDQISLATDLRRNYKHRLIFFNGIKMSLDKLLIQLE